MATSQLVKLSRYCYSSETIKDIVRKPSYIIHHDIELYLIENGICQISILLVFLKTSCIDMGPWHGEYIWRLGVHIAVGKAQSQSLPTDFDRPNGIFG